VNASRALGVLLGLHGGDEVAQRVDDRDATALGLDPLERRGHVRTVPHHDVRAGLGRSVSPAHHAARRISIARVCEVQGDHDHVRMRARVCDEAREALRAEEVNPWRVGFLALHAMVGALRERDDGDA